MDELVAALLTAARVIDDVSLRSLAAADGTITHTQFRTLVVLYDSGELNLNQLATLLGVNSSTAMRMIDKLVAAGLADRRDNPVNRREVILSVSDVGRRLVRRVSARRRNEVSKIAAAMPAAPRGRMIGDLRAFASAAGEPRESADPVW